MTPGNLVIALLSIYAVLLLVGWVVTELDIRRQRAATSSAWKQDNELLRNRR